MKKLFALFAVLLVCFCGIWVFKSKQPLNREDRDANSVTNWWDAPSELPVAEEKWTLDPEIPSNYIPVVGKTELYMVVDEDGNITEYRQREKDGDTWFWETVNPDIPDDYEPVDGLTDVYKVTREDGSVVYLKYIRNTDDTFAFVEVDKNGKPIEEDADGSSTIPENYYHVGNNIYAVYNEHGVIVGYKERLVDENGKYQWIDATAPTTTTATATTTTTHAFGVPSVTVPYQGPQSTTPSTQGSMYQGGTATLPTTKPSTSQTQGGNYIETETITTTEVKGGYRITYQTLIIRTYAPDGTLLSTQKKDPVEVSREKVSSDNELPTPSDVASTLSAEYARVSVGKDYHTGLAQAVLDVINAERATSGATALKMDVTSDAYMLAAIKATDMAENNHTDYDSAIYGTIGELCDRYGITSTTPSELLWKTTAGKDANAIASRLLLMSNDTLSSGKYQSVGIAIVSKNGYYYINLILL